MDRVQEMLENNIPLRSAVWNIEEVAKINELIPMCITLKPIVYLVNLDAKSFKRKANKWLVRINEWVTSHGGGIIIPMSVEWEQGLWAVREDAAAKEAYLGYFIVGLFCYICSFSFFLWLFSFTYALLAGLRFTCRG
jgi:obg-like ATPase 1